MVLIFALVPITALAQQALSIESIAAGNFGTETYCETGKWGMRSDPKHGFSEIAFSRCAHTDGRFKVVEYPDLPHRHVLWSDSRKYYRHSEAANYYQESPLDDVLLSWFPGNRSERYPIYLTRLFNRYSPGSSRTSTSYFQTYKANSALSTPQHSVFERYDDENLSERLWVRNADKTIVRYEGLRNGAILHFAEITSQKVDAALADADLSHDVPLFTRFSLKNDPAALVIGLFVAASFGGAVPWWWLFSRAASFEDVARKRRRLWRVQLWALGGIAIVLACLAALAIIGGGHGGLVIVFFLAMCCAVGFALAACFTLVSYPVEWLLSRVARGAERHHS